eukprot:4510780-Pleurochrysis_carterae.AAC.1
MEATGACAGPRRPVERGATDTPLDVARGVACTQRHLLERHTHLLERHTRSVDPLKWARMQLRQGGGERSVSENKTRRGSGQGKRSAERVLVRRRPRTADEPAVRQA